MEIDCFSWGGFITRPMVCYGHGFNIFIPSAADEMAVPRI
jgi:hypothetical protein